MRVWTKAGHGAAVFAKGSQGVAVTPKPPKKRYAGSLQFGILLYRSNTYIDQRWMGAEKMQDIDVAALRDDFEQESIQPNWRFH